MSRRIGTYRYLLNENAVSEKEVDTSMRISMISFSVQGAELSNRIKEQLQRHEVPEWGGLDLMQNTTNQRGADRIPLIRNSLGAWTKEQFAASDVMIFIGACGIAVRSIAPFVSDKRTDPAVLVIDDCGKYVIPLLSGHLGGANRWADRIASWIGALPVVTTASDVNRKLALDLFAERNQLFITDMRMAKVLESAYLDGEKIGVRSEFSLAGELPQGFFLCGAKHREGSAQMQYGIYIGKDPAGKDFFAQTLWLIPRNLAAGIGCRRGRSEQEIVTALESALWKTGYPPEALLGVASIDLKRDEPGLHGAVAGWSERYGKVFCDFYSAGQLQSVEGITCGSSFVREVTGVDNVCERAALFAAEEKSGKKGKLVLGKQISDGVTVALAEMERSIRFE